MNQREIKFRAWNGKTMTYLTDEYVSEGIYRSKNDGHILMQYTDSKDKNGKEIYEGDVVKFAWCDILDKEEYKGKVFFDRGSFHIEAEKDEFEPYLGEKNYIEDLEVIGNIYENKELLKQ